MNNLSEEIIDVSLMRERFIGIEEDFSLKSYYPQLKEKIESLEKVREFLVDKSARLQDMLIKYEIEKAKVNEAFSRYKSVFDNVYNGIILNDFSGKIIDANPTMAKMLGLDYNRLSDYNIKDITYDTGNQIHSIEDIYEYLKKNGSKVFEWILRNVETGNPIHTEVSLTLTLWSGNLVVLAVIKDITEKLQNENALRESELRFKMIFENMPVPIVFGELSSDRISFVNPAFTRILGYSFEEIHLLTDWFGKVFPEKSYRELAMSSWNNAINEAALTGKNPGPLEFRLRTKYAEEKDIEFVFAVNDNRLFISLHDISDIKKAEAGLAESRLKLAQHINNTPLAAIEFDSHFNVISWNKSAERIFGWKQEEIIGKSGEVLLKESDYDVIKKVFQSILNEEKKLSGINENVTKDGKVILCEWYNTTIYDLKGNAVGIASLGQDITERRDNEIKLAKYRDHLEDLVKEATVSVQKSELKFRTLAENSEDLIFRIDASGNFLYGNPAFLRIAGLSIKRLNMDLKIQDNELLDFYNLWNKVFENVISSGKIERAEHRLGSGNWYELLIMPELGKDGKISSILISGRDITEKKKYEDEIKNALVKSEELNLAKSKFVSMVSHEFRTPLSTILTSAEILEMFGNKLSDDNREAHFRKINKSIDFLTRMLDEVIAINRADSGKSKPSFSQVDIGKLCVELVSDIKATYASNHNFVYDFSPEEIVFTTDEVLIRQILSNLIVNAVKYSPDKKTIFLSMKLKENNLNLSVRDQGIGIPEGDKSSLFVAFGRASNIGTIRGTGLGLLIVKRSVDLLGGEISFTSAEGEGTEFRVSIPSGGS